MVRLICCSHRHCIPEDLSINGFLMFASIQGFHNARNCSSCSTLSPQSQSTAATLTLHTFPSCVAQLHTCSTSDIGGADLHPGHAGQDGHPLKTIVSCVPSYSHTKLCEMECIDVQVGDLHLLLLILLGMQLRLKLARCALQFEPSALLLTTHLSDCQPLPLTLSSLSESFLYRISREPCFYVDNLDCNGRLCALRPAN